MDDMNDMIDSIHAEMTRLSCVFFGAKAKDLILDQKSFYNLYDYCFRMRAVMPALSAVRNDNDRGFKLFGMNVMPLISDEPYMQIVIDKP